jgi:hypothetical protein
MAQNLKFYNGDKVSYCGKKYAKELAGQLGEVIAHVQNAENEVVVAFDKDDYILDEVHSITKFQGHLKEEKDLHVEKRSRRKPTPEEE